MSSVLFIILDTIAGMYIPALFLLSYLICYGYYTKYNIKEYFILVAICALIYDIAFTNIIGLNVGVYLLIASIVKKNKHLNIFVIALISFFLYILTTYVILLMFNKINFHVFLFLRTTSFYILFNIPVFLLVYFYYKRICINR